ncbi:hypothetical protein J7L24_00650 [bacterium]|nr:hypothetical protein [bacterium]
MGDIKEIKRRAKEIQNLLQEILILINNVENREKKEVVEKLVLVSECHHAPVKVVGMPDFIGSNEVSSMHYVCEKCGKTCDVIYEKKK